MISARSAPSCSRKKRRCVASWPAISHDGPAQALAAITMNVEFIKRLLERDPPRVIPELDRLGALAKHTTHEVRTMLFELRPLVLETQGP